MSIKDQLSDYFDNFDGYGIYYEGPWLFYRQKYVDYIKKEFCEKKNIRVLDLGCGRMCSFPSLLNMKGLVLYQCVDSSHKSTETLRSKLCNSPNVRVDEADLLDFVARCDEKFDVVILFGVIMYLDREDVMDLFSKMGRILTDDSLIVLHEPNEKAASMLDPHSQVFTANMIKKCQDRLEGNYRVDIRTYNITLLRKLCRKALAIGRKISKIVKNDCRIRSSAAMTIQSTVWRLEVGVESRLSNLMVGCDSWITLRKF